MILKVPFSKLSHHITPCDEQPKIPAWITGKLKKKADSLMKSGV